MNNTVFGKTMKNVRNHKNIKIVTLKRRRNYFVSKPNFFTENLLAIEREKNKTPMNKPDYLGLSILELSKILMY